MPPQIMMGYDWGRIFAWMSMLGGLRNINQFRVQVLPDQVLQNQAAAGNVVPMPSRPGLPAPSPAGPSGLQPGADQSTQAGLNSIAQMGAGIGY